MYTEAAKAWDQEESEENECRDEIARPNHHDISSLTQADARQVNGISDGGNAVRPGDLRRARLSEKQAKGSRLCGNPLAIFPVFSYARGHDELRMR
jgi:hypothetical protein